MKIINLSFLFTVLLYQCFPENELSLGNDAFLQRRTDWSVELSIIESWVGLEGGKWLPYLLASLRRWRVS